MEYRRINWLASYPKSGNTWVRCFMDAYFIGSVDINEILCSVSDDTATTHEPMPGVDAGLLPIDIQHLCRGMAMTRMVMLHEQANTGAPLFVKTHNIHGIINGVEILPEMLTKSVTYIVRDPRDVVPSFAKHMGVDIDKAIDQMDSKYQVLSGNEKRVADFLSDWENHVRSFLQADTHNVKVIRYEDILDDPVHWFSEILRHIGINPDLERVAKAVEDVKLGKLKKQEVDNGFKEASPKSKGFFGSGGSKSRKEMTPKQINRIEKLFGSTMKKLGYLDKVRRIA